MPSAEDVPLERKIGRQILRVIAIVCGVFVPGTLLFVAFNISAGPIITVLKWVSIAWLAISVIYAARVKPG